MDGFGAVIDAREEIDALVAVADRAPGTDAERRAAQHLRRRLASQGRNAELEATWIRPRWSLAYVAYALLGLVASVVATAAPVAGAITAGVALAAAIADLGGRVRAGLLLTGRRGSQNVVSRERGGRPGTLVLVAHYDAAHTGFAYGPPAGLAAGIARFVRRPLGGFEPLVWALAAVLVVSVLRAAGVGTPPVTVVQFVASVGLILSIPLLADIALSGVTPGASDNASGVATALRLAERYGGDLEHFDVWVLLPGAGEALAGGMREWLRRHRHSLDPTRTVFVDIDTVGSGTVRYSRRQGPLWSRALHPRLIALCDQIAEEDAGEGRYGARPMILRPVSDALAARRSGYPAITITCRDELDRAPVRHRRSDTPERIEEAALERAFGFCSELIELIDERVGPDVRALPETF